MILKLSFDNFIPYSLNGKTYNVGSNPTRETYGIFF